MTPHFMACGVIEIGEEEEWIFSRDQERRSVHGDFQLIARLNLSGLNLSGSQFEDGPCFKTEAGEAERSKRVPDLENS